MSDNTTDVNDVVIGLTVDNSITIGGDIPKTNQSVASSSTFTVNTKTDGGLAVDSGCLYVVNPANDVVIGLTGGDGITIGGSAPTTNQSAASSNTFAVDYVTGKLAIDSNKLTIDQ